MKSDKSKKKVKRVRPQKTVTLSAKNLEAHKKYKASTGKSLTALLDDLMEKFFLERGYLSDENPDKK